MDTGVAKDAGRPGQDDKQSRLPLTPLLLPEKLQIIFEVKSLVEDQIFRAVCVSQCLDMLYAAYSSDTPKCQCPTCAQPFAILVRAIEANDDKESTG